MAAIYYAEAKSTAEVTRPLYLLGQPGVRPLVAGSRVDNEAQLRRFRICQRKGGLVSLTDHSGLGTSSEAYDSGRPQESALGSGASALHANAIDVIGTSEKSKDACRYSLTLRQYGQNLAQAIPFDPTYLAAGFAQPGIRRVHYYYSVLHQCCSPYFYAITSDTIGECTMQGLPELGARHRELSRHGSSHWGCRGSNAAAWTSTVATESRESSRVA